MSAEGFPQLDLVSIVIPAFNAAKHIDECIGSVLAQTYPNTEILVVDDGSTDATPDILARYRNEKIKIIRTENLGACAARNNGARAATGRYLMFLDADDVLISRSIEAMLAGNHPHSSILLSPWNRLEIDGGEWVRKPASCRERKPDEDLLSAWLKGWFHPPCSVLWTRGAYEKTAPWDERLVCNQDGDMMLRALAMDVTVQLTSGGLGLYRRNLSPDSVSARRKTAGGLASQVRIFGKVAQILESRGRLPDYQYDLLGALASAEAACEEDPAPVLDALGVLRHKLLLPAPDGKKDPRPVVSVVIPVRDRSRLLARALRSVEHQSFRNFEIIVVDDCSTEDIRTQVEKITGLEITYIRLNKSEGPAAARNAGMARARGRYIAFLDSDDEWLPHKLDLQVRLFNSMPESVGLIYTGAYDIDPSGTGRRYEPGYRGDVLRDLLRFNFIHATSGVMIRSSVFAALGGFDAGLRAIEDFEYWIRIAEKYHFTYIAEPLTLYRHDADLRVSQNPGNDIDAWRRLYEKHRYKMARLGVEKEFLLRSSYRYLGVRWNRYPLGLSYGLRALCIPPFDKASVSLIVDLMRARKSLSRVRNLKRFLLRPGPAEAERQIRHQSLTEYEAAVPSTQVREIHPGIVAAHPMPRNRDDLQSLPPDRGWWGFSFRDVPARECTPTRLATVNDCLVACYLDEEKRNDFYPAILAGRDYSVSLKLREITFRKKHEALLRAPVSATLPEATWILERVFHNHSHWLTAHLPKLILLERNHMLKNIVIPLDSPLVNETLAVFGFDETAFIRTSLTQPLKVGKLTLLETDRFGDQLIQMAAARIGELFPVRKAPWRRVYISRKRADRRRLLNEDEVYAAFAQHGFERVEMEGLSLAEQIALMRETAVLAGSHGAGLTNMMFCSPGAEVIEIADLTFPNPNFYALASALGHGYWLLSGNPVGDGAPLSRDLRIPLCWVSDVLHRLDQR